MHRRRTWESAERSIPSPLPPRGWIVAKRIEAKRGRPRHREKDQRDRPLPTNRARHWQSFVRTTLWPTSHLLYRRSRTETTSWHPWLIALVKVRSLPFPSQIERDIRPVDGDAFENRRPSLAAIAPTWSWRWWRNCDAYLSVFAPLSTDVLIKHNFLIVLVRNNFVSARGNGMKFTKGAVKDKIFVQSFFLPNILGCWFYTYIRLIKTSRPFALTPFIFRYRSSKKNCLINFTSFPRQRKCPRVKGHVDNFNFPLCSSLGGTREERQAKHERKEEGSCVERNFVRALRCIVPS